MDVVMVGSVGVGGVVCGVVWCHGVVVGTGVMTGVLKLTLCFYIVYDYSL